MLQPNPARKQIIQEGKRICEERLKEAAERDHLGQFMVIDVQTGNFEIGKSDTTATLQILRRRPEALLYGIRIGDTVAYRFGHRRVSDPK